MADNPLLAIGRAAREASYSLGACTSADKEALLMSMADALIENKENICDANRQDYTLAQQAGISPAMLDRLELTPARLNSLAEDIRGVARLHDPIGQYIDGSELRNGLTLVRKRVPLGVIAAIYEARPNVTADVAALCLKTGNAAILRGGKETRLTNEALLQAIHQTLEHHGLPVNAVQAITDPDRSLVQALLRLDTYVDMLIPRGGTALQRLCKESSHIPVITGGIGVCHIYVDATAELDKTLPLLENAKVQRPSVCNAMETLLVHKDKAQELLPQVASMLHQHGVTLHATPEAMPYLRSSQAKVLAATEEGLGHEWLSLDLNVHVVTDLAEAIKHIRTYGTGHSEAIMTEDMHAAEAFTQQVDAAALYVNASTRFTDGGEFGLGAEVAVSTQKLHARGPMGLDALTTYKWIAHGNYTVRQ